MCIASTMMISSQTISYWLTLSVPRGPTLPKIVYEISKSIDFNEITLISSDFTDFKVISNIYNYLYYISN